MSLIAALVLAQAPASLSDATFAQVRDFATPKAVDLGFQEIDWKPSIYAGIEAAQKEDKPLFLWMYFGDPRGHC